MTGMALTHCILGKFLGVVFHWFPPPLDDPSVRNDARDPSSERWNCGRERCPVVILPEFRFPRKFRDLLHAANLRHGTDGFTSPPKEGVLRIFFALKIRRLRSGLNLGTKGQHATPRPPKPVDGIYCILNGKYWENYLFDNLKQPETCEHSTTPPANVV